MKVAVLVNGVPASGKSTVAHALSKRLDCPLLALDTVKEALFGELGIGDRDYNRQMGRASFAAIWGLVGAFPPHGVVVVDAWFGFQPLDFLRQHLRAAEVGRVVEIWCHAPPDEIAQRYAERCQTRHAGHLGLEYVPELRALAARAAPTGLGRRIDVDTSLQISWQALGEAVAAAVLAAAEAQHPDEIVVVT